MSKPSQINLIQLSLFILFIPQTQLKHFWSIFNFSGFVSSTNKSINSKIPVSGPSPIFLWPKSFSIKSNYVIHNLIRVSNTMPKFKETYLSNSISYISSRDMVNEKFSQNDCLRPLWPISQDLNFSQTWDLHKNIPNSTNSVKIHHQSSQ